MGMLSHHMRMGRAPWLDPAFNRRSFVRINSAFVAADESAYTPYLPASFMHSTFFANLQPNGEDIRFTMLDGFTPLARAIPTLTVGSSVGILNVGPMPIFASRNSGFFVYYDNPLASAPATGDTYGRDAVWVDRRAVYDFQESNPGTDPIVDATGNGYTLADIGGMSASDSVPGPLEGDCFEFNSGSNQGLFHNNDPFSGTPAYPFMLEASVYTDVADIVPGLVIGILDRGVSNSYADFLMHNALGGIPRLNVRTPGEGSDAVDGPDDLRGAWHHLAAIYNSSTERQLIVDGALEITGTAAFNIPTNINGINIGYRNDFTPGGYMNGKIAFPRIWEISKPFSYFTTQVANYMNPNTFLTVYPEEILVA